jgi:hypothetical protein
MHKTLFAALAAAALLSGGMLGSRAEAMTLAPSALGVADAGLVVKAAVVCGYYGCVRTAPRYYAGGYYGRPYYGRGYGYYGRRW